jgi:hypothetical protein
MNPDVDDPDSTKLSESVATRILGLFTGAVAQEDDLKEVAERLRVVVVEQGDLSEASLRDALFGKAP